MCIREHSYWYMCKQTYVQIIAAQVFTMRQMCDIILNYNHYNKVKNENQIQSFFQKRRKRRRGFACEITGSKRANQKAQENSQKRNRMVDCGYIVICVCA